MKAYLVLVPVSLIAATVFSYVARDWSEQRASAIGLLCVVPYSLFVSGVLIAFAPLKRKP